MLLHRSVWSFTNITFHVIHLERTCPDFLFIIKDLTTIEEEVLKAVRQVPLGTDTPLVSKTHHFRSRFSPPPQHRKLEF
jgi:hypothetical protein